MVAEEAPLPDMISDAMTPVADMDSPQNDEPSSEAPPSRLMITKMVRF